MKNCYSCKQDKPFTEYRKDKTKKDGYNTYCKSCNKLKKGNNTPREKKVIKDIPEIMKWLQENYNQLIINTKKTCGTGYNQWGEDLLPFIVKEFLEKPTDYQLKVYKDGKIENWITNAMSFQLKSSTSPFYIQYRRNLINERSAEINDLKHDDIEYDKTYDDLESIILNSDFEFKDALHAIYFKGEELKTYCRNNNVNYYKAQKYIPKYIKVLKQEMIQLGY